MSEELLSVARSVEGMTAHLLKLALAREHFDKRYKLLTYGEIAILDEMVKQAAAGGRMSIVKAIIDAPETPKT
jgi:hypothetical protein